MKTKPSIRTLYRKKSGILFTLFFTLLFNFSYGQVSINTDGTAPDASSMLDVVSTNKGVLLPRVALTGTGSASPVTSPATGLMVYNTATTGDVTPGYYWWNGSAWVRFGNGTGTGGEWTDAGTMLYPSDDASQLTRVYENAAPVYRLFAKSRSAGDYAEGYLGYYGSDFEATNRHIGAYGEAGTGVNNWGVVGKYGSNDYGYLGGNGRGVYGKSSTIAVYGQCSGDKAIYGESTHNSGAGIYGYSTGALGYGVYGKSTNYAGYFEGHGMFTGSNGDINVYMVADADNSGENDNPRLELRQDGAAVIGGLGFTGDAGQIFTNSLANALYLENDYASGGLQLATNSTAQLTILSDGKVGIGDNSPASLFTVGSGDPFQVGTDGDLDRIKNIPYSWPTSNVTGTLFNDGTGNLSWAGSSWEKVLDITVTNQTSYTLNGLDGNDDVGYKIIMMGSHGNPNSDIKNCWIQPNGDNSTANYSYGMDAYWLYRGGYGWSYDCYDLGGLFIWSTDANANPNYCESETIISSFTGSKRHAVSRYSLGLGGNNIVVNLSAGVWDNTATNITSLVFNWEGATGFTGRIIVYAMH